MSDSITAHKKSQEYLSKLLFPICKIYYFSCSFFWNILRLEGIRYGVIRAMWRAKLLHLGEYSDISSDVTIKTPGNLSIGVRSSISEKSFLDAGGGIIIGDFVMISHMVSINSQTHPTIPPYQGLIKAETIIEDYAWIGARSVIREGVRIGTGAIVGAGSVVTDSVQPWTIVAGCPAKFIRFVNTEGTES